MRFVMILAVGALLAGPASAQSFLKLKPKSAPAPAMKTVTTTTTASTSTKTRKPRTPESLDCSKQADAKGLHGVDRKKFRASCMKAAT